MRVLDNRIVPSKSVLQYMYKARTEGHGINRNEKAESRQETANFGEITERDNG